MRATTTLCFRRRIQLIACASIVTLISLVGESRASYHTYRFAEVYSNSSGTIQFIELHEDFGASGQNLEHLAPDIKSNAHDLILTDLPNANTANTFFLLGTAGYNALPGAPHADYLIPNNFINPAGDTLQYGSTGPDGIVDVTTFGALPTSGGQALYRTETSGNVFTTGAAIANTFSSGGNFAVVPEPSTLVLAAFGFIALAWRLWRRQSKPTWPF
jgi:PEP-CTERM motif